IDGGWAIPVFDVPETPPLDNKKNAITQPQPVMMEARLDLGPATRSWHEPRWDEALPLSMTVAPPAKTHNHNLILQLFSTPAFFTSGFKERLKTIQWLRSNQPNRQTEEKHGATSHSRTNRPSRPSSVPQETVEIVQAEVAFVIAMPMPPPPVRFSSATMHEPLLEVAGQELCLGSISSAWQRPLDNAAAAVAANQSRLSWQTEDVEDFASTIRTWPAGPARSIVSSRHLYVGDYGDEASSYAMRPSGSFVYSGSGYDTQASQPAPSQQQHDQRSAAQANSLLSPPSRAYTPSQRSMDLPSVPAYMIPHIQVTEPRDVEIASTPTDLPLTQDGHSIISISSYGQ
ncbi:16524_t:CDS:2, partial [Acaulospora colombiana]